MVAPTAEKQRDKEKESHGRNCRGLRDRDHHVGKCMLITHM